MAFKHFVTSAVIDTSTAPVVGTGTPVVTFASVDKKTKTIKTLFVQNNSAVPIGLFFNRAIAPTSSDTPDWQVLPGFSEVIQAGDMGRHLDPQVYIGVIGATGAGNAVLNAIR